MPTRFYLHSSGSQPAPNNPAFNAGWEQTGQATRLPCDVATLVAAGSKTALTTSATITVPITTTQQICAYQFTSRQVFHPVRLGTDVLFSCVLRCSENATTNNAFIAHSLRAVTASGATFLATLIGKLASGGTEYALHASQATRTIAQTAISAVTISEPFRFVWEVGSHAQAPTAAGNFQQRIGCNAASDFALTEALTTDLNPWFELSVNLEAMHLNNYQDINAGRG